MARTTPQLPDDLRTYSHEGYTNIYEVLPSEPRVFGTESLFGDWDAEILLLAKDYAPSRIIDRRIRAGDPRPYRHGDRDLERMYTPPGCRPDFMGCRSNDNLKKLAPALGGMPLLYGSAFGGLMRKDGKTSGTLPDEETVLNDYAVPLLKWCVTQLSNLRGITCLGTQAYATVTRCMGRPHLIRDYGEHWTSVFAERELILFKLHHPAARGMSIEAKRKEWEQMARTLRR